ncbi:Pycsar system effector family protein [Thiobacillus sp.]|uniref:Pycsar system effector family protein n=1 Tax=Thiobacillus sp. TaxID=924 RepID=UPI00286D91A1|nr:Pycsar system effector family protein [Thiobacillus sp.]
MTNDLERLKVAQWILERNLGWIAAAEIKVGVIVALDTAMLGVLATSFSSLLPAERTAWANLFMFLAAITIVVAIICAAMSVLPRVNGPKKSLLFFGRIAQLHHPNYVANFRAATESELLEDCLAQIHRNAEIARDKFMWVGRSMKWSFLSLAPWVTALSLLVKT